MKLPRYPKYKDSGVEWLSEVPEHWETKRVSHIADLIAGFAFPSEEFGFDPEAGIPLVRGDNVTEGWLRWGEKGRYWPLELEYDIRYLLEANDIVIQMDGSKVGKNWAFISNDDLPALLVQRVTRVRVTGASPKFIYSLFSNEMFIRYVDRTKTDPAVPHITMKNIGDYPIPLPPPLEQVLISTFLEHETGKIDALVEEQRRLIELLKEKRQAVISHAVTKGLNPDAPMKDSGIEWLGKVPEHWRMKRLKHTSPSITVGIVVEPSKYYCDEGVPALRSLNILQGRVVEENLVYISPQANDLLSKSQLRAGDLVVVRSGQPGTAAVVPLELEGCNCIDLIIIRKPEDGDSRFLCWYLASDHALRQFTEGTEGAIQQHFNVGTAMNLVAPVPSVLEQQEIVEFIVKETTKIDELTQNATRAIDLLQERRTALISAAVTGKIDVRGLSGTEAA